MIAVQIWTDDNIIINKTKQKKNQFIFLSWPFREIIIILFLITAATRHQYNIVENIFKKNDKIITIQLGGYDEGFRVKWRVAL